MRRAHTWLPPTTICEVFTQAGGGGSQACVQRLWAQLAAPTVTCLMDGTRVLAALWTAAYMGPGGQALVDRIDPRVLQRIYEDPQFLPSRHLHNLNPAEYALPTGLPALVQPAVSRKGTKPAVAQPGGRRNTARAIRTPGRA